VNIHEYQGKEIFTGFGLPVPGGTAVQSVDDAVASAEEYGLPVMVKSQVLIGGRGKAGGVKFCETIEDVKKNATNILGMDIKGHTVRTLLITPAVDIDTELYIGMLIDRNTKRVMLMASAEGGIDIETVAKDTPELIFKQIIDPRFGLLDHEARGRASWPRPCRSSTWLSSNPTPAWRRSIPGSSLPRASAMPLTPRSAWTTTPCTGIPVTRPKLSGNVGCLVNGAGLAMATMDLVKYYGGQPANFLDIGGSSNPEKVVNALNIILADKEVKAILFNIFGGITRCDDVANGIIAATKSMDIKVPIVVRLTGTNEAEGRALLAQTDLVTADTMDDVVKKAIELAG